MDMLKKFFPDAFRSKDVNSFVITLLIYGVGSFLIGLVLGLLAKIPLIGFVFTLIGSLVGLYALVGIILAILVFAQVIKE
jgi:hypothetical protein